MSDRRLIKNLIWKEKEVSYTLWLGVVEAFDPHFKSVDKVDEHVFPSLSLKKVV